jgi:hypothetical protein
LLEEAVNKAKNELPTYSQQNIVNNGEIQKQVNIGIVNGQVTL